MKHFNWWTIVLLLISQTYAASLNDAKTQERESDLKQDAKELIKAAATSAEYSATSLANDYQSDKQQQQQQQQDNIASSSSVSAVESNSNYNNVPNDNQQYSQPLSYSQPGTPVQPIHSYSQPLNYPSQALPYTSESQQISSQYGSQQQQYGNSADANNQYGSLKDVPMQEIPNMNSQYYPQYPAHQQYNPHLVLQQQASAPVSDYHQASPSQYESNQATYVQPIQHQNVYLHHQHHVAIPGSSYSEQSYVVDNGGDKNAYPQANSYSQPLPPEYSPEYSNNNQQAAVSSSNNVQIKPKKTVILAIPVKLVAKNKYSGQNNGGNYAASSSAAEISQPHYSTNVVPAAANLPVTHSIEKNNYNNDYEKPSFNEKPLYADKPSYTDKAEEYPKVNHNLNNNLNNNNGYNNGGEYESDNNGDNYGRNQEHGRYNGPQYKQQPQYNPGREVKPLSNYQSNRPRRPNYGPEINEYSSGHGGEEEISVGPEHIQPSYSSVGEIEHNHIHSLPHHLPHHKHHNKLNEIYEPVDHVPPYIPSDFPSLGGSIGGLSSGLSGGLSGLGGYPNPMELIYSNPYKLNGPPHGYGPPPPKPSYGGRPSLLGSASSQNPTSTSSTSNYGQFLSSLLSAYSLGSLKPSGGKPSSSSGKSGLASYLNNLPGFDLLKGYTALSPSSYGSLLTSASGLNKYYYLPNPASASAKPAINNKPNYNNYLGWPAELTQQAAAAKPKPSGLLASSSNIVSSFDELFKSSLTGSSNKFKRPIYSDATRAITNLYKKLLN